MSYNPFIASVSAVITELSSTEAKSYYASRALEDIDRVITVVEAVYALASMVYELGVICGEAHYNAVTETFTAPAPVQPCLHKPRAILTFPTKL